MTAMLRHDHPLLLSFLPEACTFSEGAFEETPSVLLSICGMEWMPNEQQGETPGYQLTTARVRTVRRRRFTSIRSK